MKKITFTPFENFKCIADKCKHSCCVGWEISIDKKTLKKYKRDKSGLRQKLKNCIDYKNCVFVKTQDNRCPFLNERNLCDIISVNGEGALCQVCSDHPRFRNFFSDRIEEGVSLSCEKAVELLINYEGELTSIEKKIKGRGKRLKDFEKQVLEYRQKVLDKVFEKNLSFTDKLEDVLFDCNCSFSKINFGEVKKVFSKLERLEDDLFIKINSLERLSFEFKKEHEGILQKLLWYFVIKHLGKAIDKLDIKSRTIFCALSVVIVYNLFINFGTNETEDFMDIIREYSSEIEYSEDNFYALLDLTDNMVGL